MPTYATLTDQATDRFLQSCKPAQDVTIALAGAVSRVTGRLPLPNLPSVLPSAADVLQANASAAERLLTAQRDFVARLTATAPVTAVVPEQAQASSNKQTASAKA